MEDEAVVKKPIPTVSQSDRQDCWKHKIETENQITLSYRKLNDQSVRILSQKDILQNPAAIYVNVILENFHHVLVFFYKHIFQKLDLFS